MPHAGTHSDLGMGPRRLLWILMFADCALVVSEAPSLMPCPLIPSSPRMTCRPLPKELGKGGLWVGRGQQSGCVPKQCCSLFWGTKFDECPKPTMFSDAHVWARLPLCSCVLRPANMTQRQHSHGSMRSPPQSFSMDCNMLLALAAMHRLLWWVFRLASRFQSGGGPPTGCQGCHWSRGRLWSSINLSGVRPWPRGSWPGGVSAGQA